MGATNGPFLGIFVVAIAISPLTAPRSTGDDLLPARRCRSISLRNQQTMLQKHKLTTARLRARLMCGSALVAGLMVLGVLAPASANPISHGSQGSLPDLYTKSISPKESAGAADARVEVPANRFGRMFEIDATVTDFEGRRFRIQPHPSDVPALRALGRIDGPMHEKSDAESRDSNVPAGHIFFGQFIDHDITFDTVSRLDTPARARDTENARTPALDLDSIYGGGPERSPYLYDMPYLVLGDEIVPGRYDVLRRGAPGAAVASAGGGQPVYEAKTEPAPARDTRSDQRESGGAVDALLNGGGAGDINSLLFGDGDDTYGQPRDPQPAPRAEPEPVDPPPAATPPRGGASPHARGRTVSRVALIGDPRNDENVVITQLQAAFITFHNSIVDRLLKHENVDLAALRAQIAAAQTRGEQRELETRLGQITREIFEAARNHTIHYYHRTIVEDYLPHILGQNRVNEIRTQGRQFYFPDGFRDPSTGDVREPFIPIEFSTAAFRYGHSQIRGLYNLSRQTQGVPLFGAGRGPQNIDMMGFKPMIPELMIDWAYFFTMDPSRWQDVQSARPMDTRIPDPLFKLVEAGVVPAGDVESLAARNLNRGRTFRLPSGQMVARAMGLPPELILEADPVTRETLGVDETPLWYYVLQEAKQQGITRERKYELADAGRLVPTSAVYSGRAAAPESMTARVKEMSGSQGGDILGPVGGTIVGEVLLGLIDHYRDQTGRGLDFVSVIDGEMSKTPLRGGGTGYHMGNLLTDAGLGGQL